MWRGGAEKIGPVLFARTRYCCSSGITRILDRDRRTRMTIEEIRTTIDSERAILLPLRDKVTSSFFKEQCQRALDDLDMWEYLCFRRGSERPSLQLVVWFLRIVVEQ